jgi:hypothetical protein
MVDLKTPKSGDMGKKAVLEKEKGWVFFDKSSLF